MRAEGLQDTTANECLLRRGGSFAPQRKNRDKCNKEKYGHDRPAIARATSARVIEGISLLVGAAIIIRILSFWVFL